MKAALLQLTSGDDPVANLEMTTELVAEAASAGATFILTPEVTNCVSRSRSRQNEVLATETDDITLDGLRKQAAELSVDILIGSLAIKTRGEDGRFANRSFLIGSDGEIVARYDKIHMFDVQVSDAETYRESAGYRPGDTAVLAPVGAFVLGMTVCYDLRFPYLYRDLAKAGATLISIPSAFSPVTGAAHWEPLLRARAIETGCYVLAPAQTGEHPTKIGRPRRTYGHSLVVSPWGDVIADGGTEAGIIYVELDPSAVEDARHRVPSLQHDREYSGPQ